LRTVWAGLVPFSVCAFMAGPAACTAHGQRSSVLRCVGRRRQVLRRAPLTLCAYLPHAPRRRRLAWAGTAVAGALVITAIAVGGGPRRATIELEWMRQTEAATTTAFPQPRTVQDAYPVPNHALREYLEHTGGSSKLARSNPSIASRIEAGDAGDGALSASSAGGGGIQARLQALHLHQMVSCTHASRSSEHTCLRPRGAWRLGF
jgi:hypothetical protein